MICAADFILTMTSRRRQQENWGSISFRAKTGRRYFVILTTAPNACMQGIHDRMPLMVERNEVRDFILDGQAADELRKKPMPELIPHRPFEQMSFHF